MPEGVMGLAQVGIQTERAVDGDFGLGAGRAVAAAEVEIDGGTPELGVGERKSGVEFHRLPVVLERAPESGLDLPLIAVEIGREFRISPEIGVIGAEVGRRSPGGVTRARRGDHEAKGGRDLVRDAGLNLEDVAQVRYRSGWPRRGGRPRPE